MTPGFERRSPLLARDEFRSTILLVAPLGRGGADWPFFTETDGIDARFRNPLLQEELADRGRPQVAQTDVVLLATAFVGVTADGESDAGILLQEPGVRLEASHLIRANLRPVVVEEDRLNVVSEEFLDRRLRCAR